MSLANVNAHFSKLIQELGPIPKAAGYPDPEQQRIRYDELAKLFERSKERFSLLDYGCGYGAFLDYLRERAIPCDYWGYDMSEAMLAAAQKAHPGDEHRFLGQLAPEARYDYIVVCGSFNQRAGTDADSWQRMIEGILDDFDRRAEHGFAFNMLSAYRDPHRKLEINYYGDPLHYFDLCFRRYSPNVALAHDYNLWDFTIIVRKLPPRILPAEPAK